MSSVWGPKRRTTCGWKEDCWSRRNERPCRRLARSLSDLGVDLALHQNRIARSASVHIRRITFSAGLGGTLGDRYRMAPAFAEDPARLAESRVGGEYRHRLEFRTDILGRAAHQFGAGGGSAGDDPGVRPCLRSLLSPERTPHGVEAGGRPDRGRRRGFDLLRSIED